jgi:hypothetical protein
MMRRALCVGINDYPGILNDLDGCINDMKSWAATLTAFGFDVATLADAQATKADFLQVLEDMLAQSGAGDYVAVCYSGHGTHVKDTSGDETDRWDEALYLYDDVLLDDELYDALGKADAETRVVFVMDSCFSGTVTRALNVGAVRGKARYVRPPDMPLYARVVGQMRDLPEEGMVELLLSACGPNEYSYERCEGTCHGAFTFYAISALESGISYTDWHARVRAILPSSEFPQSPQLEGRIAFKALPVFGTEPGIEPPVPGLPGEPSGCLSGLVQAVAAYVARCWKR